MRHINDNMDELFQKAAEGYPLRTDNPDWETVHKKLLVKNNNIRNYSRPLQQFLTLAILLFIPLGIAVTESLLHDAFTGKATTAITNKNLSALQSNSEETSITPGKAAGVSSNYMAAAFNEAEKHLPASISFDIITNGYSAMHLQSDLIIQKKVVAGNVDLLKGMNLYSRTINNFINTSAESKKDNNIVETGKQTVSQDNYEKDPIHLQSSSPKKIYTGIFLAPELTSVKAQSFRKLGSNIGFMVGYNFNSRLQGEIGLSLSQKYYYANGKYAAPNSLRQDELEIGNIKAFSSVTEIPVTVRYNIKNTGDNKFFVAAGAVSSIVHQERYNYGYTKNGRERKGFKKYDVSADNLFSNLQFSVGYEHKVGKIGSMRIEPYYRLPLNGIGVSNLPVTSMGINFGLIKYF